MKIPLAQLHSARKRAAGKLAARGAPGIKLEISSAPGIGSGTATYFPASTTLTCLVEAAALDGPEFSIQRG